MPNHQVVYLPIYQLGFKANQGVQVSDMSVTNWIDQNPSGGGAEQATASSQPTLLSSDLNFNPAIDFDGTNHFLIDSSSSLASGDNVYAYIVMRTDTQAGNGNGAFSSSTTGADQNRIAFFPGYVFDDKIYWDSGDIATGGRMANQTFASTGTQYGDYYAWTLISQSAVGQEIRRNGFQIDSDSTTSSFGGSPTLWVGRHPPGGVTCHLNGAISELVVYVGAQTANEVEQIQTYLALKYGFTLSHDYKDSEGTVVRSFSGAYINNIAGIAREDRSDLNQKRSSSGIITIGLGSIALDNASNTNTFPSDQNYTIFGDDNGSVASLSADYLGTNNNGIPRVWSVQQTGTGENVMLQALKSDLPSGIITLIVSSSSSFPTGSTTSENCNIKCPKEDIVKQECSMPKSSRFENSTEDKKRRKTWNKSRVVFIPEKASI